MKKDLIFVNIILLIASLSAASKIHLCKPLILPNRIPFAFLAALSVYLGVCLFHIITNRLNRKQLLLLLIPDLLTLGYLWQWGMPHEMLASILYVPIFQIIIILPLPYLFRKAKAVPHAEQIVAFGAPLWKWAIYLFCVGFIPEFCLIPAGRGLLPIISTIILYATLSSVILFFLGTNVRALMLIGICLMIVCVPVMFIGTMVSLQGIGGAKDHIASESRFMQQTHHDFLKITRQDIEKENSDHKAAMLAMYDYYVTNYESNFKNKIDKLRIEKYGECIKKILLWASGFCLSLLHCIALIKAFRKADRNRSSHQSPATTKDFA